MAKVGLFFGTQTGNTETAAEMIQKELGEENVDLIDIAEASIEDFDKYNYLIIGCPTWNIGELQSDWDGFFPNLDEMDFTGKTVAYFGVGDQFGYPDNFQDAMGILAEKIAERGGKNVGAWPIDGYEFNESRGLVNGQFVGLALDEDNQSELTEKRVKEWTAKLKPMFGL
ncbi:flavodoxin FldA [Thermostichus vulcanus]|uniref:Flavodoxin n=1 Tax=Thermostichus vulcanus str. 'Rupite' TaxID=2813851 RepID=A0ABT0CFI6_THEVL|nr:flavodoxin FldA [Thermostichus vulcanus str. 'Rupite']